MAQGRIEVDETLCKGCSLCAMVCPKDLIVMVSERLTPKGYHPAELVDPNGECTGCAICAVICPDISITVYRYIPVKQAVQAA